MKINDNVILIIKNRNVFNFEINPVFTGLSLGCFFE